MINRYRDKHILEMCMDMVYVCVHKDVCWLPVLLFACQQWGNGGGGGEIVWISNKWKKNIYSYTFARVVVLILHRICLEEVSCCQVANWVHQKKGHLGCETKWDKAFGHKTHIDAVQQSIEQARSVRVSFIITEYLRHTRVSEGVLRFIVTVFTFEQNSDVVRRRGTWSTFDNQTWFDTELLNTCTHTKNKWVMLITGQRKWRFSWKGV